MILPPDDSVIIPPTNDGELVTDATNPPAPSLADTQALLPGWARRGPSALRDAWLTAWGKVANTVWARTSFALEAQQSPRFAEGTGLDWHGQRRTMPRVAGESDSDYRARLLAFSDVVSPNAVNAAVAQAVGPTQTAPVSIEPAVDAIFLSTTSSPWQAFVQSPTQRLWANYPDRPSGTKAGAYVVEAVGGQGGGTTKTPGIARFWIYLQANANDDTSVPCLQPATAAVKGRLIRSVLGRPIGSSNRGARRPPERAVGSGERGTAKRIPILDERDHRATSC